MTGYSMITKAVIPIAGKGTRLRPITSVVPKALFPLVDKQGNIKSVLQVILEQVKSAGIDDAAIIVSRGQQEILEKFFKSVRDGTRSQLPNTIEYIEQTEPKGFGDAVYQAKDFVGGESVLLLLGDYVYVSQNDCGCISQVTKAFDQMDCKAMIGVQSTPQEVLHTVGVTKGLAAGQDGIYICTDFIEKPTLQQARDRLKTEGLSEGSFLAHCGIYAFTGDIFRCLEDVNNIISGTGTELELAAGQSILLENNPNKYGLCEINGRAYDTGNPKAYAQAFQTMLKGNTDG